MNNKDFLDIDDIFPNSELFQLDTEIESLRIKNMVYKPYDKLYQKNIKDSLKLIDKWFKIFNENKDEYEDEMYVTMIDRYKTYREKFKTQIENYNNGSLKKPDKTIIILFGPSASGKSTIAFELEKQIPRLITHTTREKRIGEVDGYDYHFVSKEKYKELNLIEKPENYDGSNYGLTMGEINRVFENNDIAVSVMTRNGIYELNKNTNHDIRPVYITADIKTISERLNETSNSKRNHRDKFNRLYDAIHNWDYRCTDITNVVFDTSHSGINECVSEIMDYVDNIRGDHIEKD